MVLGRTNKAGGPQGELLSSPTPVIGAIRTTTEGVLTTFSPANIPNLVWWIDPNDSDTITYDVGDEILIINDKATGDALARLQQEITPVAKPGLFTREEGGVTWMEGNGTNRCLRVAFTEEDQVNFGSGELTIFIVAKREFTDTTVNKGLLQKGGGEGFYQMVMRQPTDGDGAILARIYDGVSEGGDEAAQLSATGTVNNGDKFIFRCVRNNTTEEFTAALNGSSIAAAASTTNLGDLDVIDLELFVGCQPNSSTTQSHWDGLIGEILFYKRALSNSELDQVESYLANKWGVTL